MHFARLQHLSRSGSSGSGSHQETEETAGQGKEAWPRQPETRIMKEDFGPKHE
jgi:hypothetical protein